MSIIDVQFAKIDMIITKSISRFTRNTQDCLKFVRELKDGYLCLLRENATNTMIAKGKVPLTIDISNLTGITNHRMLPDNSVETARNTCLNVKDTNPHFNKPYVGGVAPNQLSPAMVRCFSRLSTRT